MVTVVVDVVRELSEAIPDVGADAAVLSVVVIVIVLELKTVESGLLVTYVPEYVADPEV